MRVLDRTEEFHQILASLQSKGCSTPGIAKQVPQPSQTLSYLNSLAAEIGTEIHNSSMTVQELRKLARRKEIFNNRAHKIQELTFEVQQSIHTLKGKLEVLDSTAKKSGPNSSSNTHSSAMVETLKNRLCDLANGLKEALEVRTKVEEQQGHRRQMYKLSQGNLANPLAQSNALGSLNDYGVSNASQEQQVTEIQYSQARSDSVRSMQRTICELAGMFKDMTVAVTSQQDKIQRIDEEIGDTLHHCQEGQDQLLTFYNGIASNRMLISKVFAILICFVVFFVVFLS